MILQSEDSQQFFSSKSISELAFALPLNQVTCTRSTVDQQDLLCMQSSWNTKKSTKINLQYKYYQSLTTQGVQYQKELSKVQ